jgi:hypothetical protein
MKRCDEAGGREGEVGAEGRGRRPRQKSGTETERERERETETGGKEIGDLKDKKE